MLNVNIVISVFLFGVSKNVVALFCFWQIQVHTPDSSRYWIANSYEERFKNGLEPENVDKVYFLSYARIVLACKMPLQYLKVETIKEKIND